MGVGVLGELCFDAILLLFVSLGLFGVFVICLSLIFVIVLLITIIGGCGDSCLGSFLLTTVVLASSPS